MPKSKSPKPRTINLARRESTPFNPADGLTSKPAKMKRAPDRMAENQPPVEPVICPSVKDTRYTPVLPPGGGEMMQEWNRLRGARA